MSPDGEIGEIDLAPLEQVTARLREAVAGYAANPDSLIHLESLVKRFELTFELTRTTLIKYMRTYSPNLREREELSFATIIRTANQDGLVQGTWKEWHGFRESRNRASHAYNLFQARAIAQKIPAFLSEVEFLLKKLKEGLSDAAKP